jgi:NRAMP (natural resistance-associated macrophage protein)-like metal ion transporter
MHFAGGRFRTLFRALGPGLTTGAADDDPSGIATYSIAGAQFGNAFLSVAFITWPLMACVQMMCARIGMVTGNGLAAALRQKMPRPVVAVLCTALLAANTINIASDLAGMADAAEMLGGGSSHAWVWIFGVGICIATVFLRYRQIARALRWLALTLLAYVICALTLHPQWGEVWRDILQPRWPHGREAWSALVALLGTTISPYLFFWQAGQEVEEERGKGRSTVEQRRGATREEIVLRRIDVAAGTFASNLVMFFIILTTALTLHAHGVTHIETTKDAAQALRPIAGEHAYLLFTLGLVGTGLLSIPTLAGSAAYAFAETFGWACGLDQTLRNALPFYSVFIFATAIGATLDVFDVDPMKALWWAAIINGLVAPVLLAGTWLVGSDSRIMRGQRSSATTRAVVAMTTVVMTVAAVAMVASH